MFNFCTALCDTGSTKTLFAVAKASLITRLKQPISLSVGGILSKSSADFY